MIALARVDNRLIHGQILEAWVPHLGAKAIVVADDEAARSPLARAAMTLAVSPDITVVIEPIESLDWDGIARGDAPTLVLLREVAEAERAWRTGMTPARAPRINLGNVHFAAGRKAVTPSVFLSPEELDRIRALTAAGFVVEARAIPSDAPVCTDELVQRFGEAG